MKVLYEPFLRRARSHNSTPNGSTLEICHPGEFHLPKNGNQHESHNNMNNGSSFNANGSKSRNVRHIIDYDAICINKELGVGEFGVVQQGTWTNPEGQSIQVAVKCLSAARLENSRQEFLKEATIMHSIAHEHVVTLYGIVLDPSIMLVTELAPLRSLLECLKEPALVTHFPVMSLCVFAAQIADGMAYLESKRLIHRDLAARNILVFTKNKVKISDFGLSRALGVGKDYYQSNFNVNLKLPIAWCAPECINYLKFTSQSDVWAYGVTLWEMFSFGYQPWASLTGQQILEAIDQPNHRRLEQPEYCPRDYYQLMLKCWSHEPSQRPNFSEILQILPDCKPEMLQAIRSSTTQHSMPSLLQYKTGDIVTVIDKNSMICSPTVESANDAMKDSSSWKGVNNDRKVGLFNPSDFVTFLGMNLPSTNVPSSATNTFEKHHSANGNGHGNHHGSHHSLASTITSTLSHSSKFIRGILDASKHHIAGGSSPNNSRKNMNGNGSNNNGNSNGNGRLRADMISRPQGEVKHAGHVGADGVFGDVPFGSGNGNGNSNAIQDNGTSSSKKPQHLSLSHGLTFAAHQQHLHSSHSGHNGNLYTTKDEADHEYQEISDEEVHFMPVESPSFEVMDFGPSLMDEVLGALDHHQIKPDLGHETDNETAHNEHGMNLKNEVRELNLKYCKDGNSTNSRKKHSSVKPITQEEENELDSAIAMAKDIASRSLMQEEYDMIPADSPKTPNSPNKRKSHFTFKFPSTNKHHNHSPKGERRNFSEETNAIGDIIESITPAAKEAYLSLIEGRGFSKPEIAPKPVRPEVKPPPPPAQQSQSSQMSNVHYQQHQPQTSQHSQPLYATQDEVMDNNPLRMLRTAGIVRPKVRGNRSFSQPRLPTTAGLARVASARSQLGSPPPVPNEPEEHYSHPSSASIHSSAQQMYSNALPLPPRDRTRPLIQLKMHQRRHPLVLPMLDNNGQHDFGAEFGAHNLYDSVQRVAKQVSCPQPPAAFLNSYNARLSNGDCEALVQPKNAFSHDDSGESLEDVMTKAFDNIRMSQSIDYESSLASALPSTSQASEPEMSKSSSHIYSSNYGNGNMISADGNSSNGNPSDGYLYSSFASSDMSNGNAARTSTFAQPAPLVLPNGSNGMKSISQNNSKEIASMGQNSVKNNLDCDEVRVMQKVLGNEHNLSDQECYNLLVSTDMDVHKAIKCVKLKEQVRSKNINIDCDWAKMIAKFNWNIRQASNYLIATQGVPEDTTEV